MTMLSATMTSLMRTAGVLLLCAGLAACTKPADADAADGGSAAASPDAAAATAAAGAADATGASGGSTGDPAGNADGSTGGATSPAATPPDDAPSAGTPAGDALAGGEKRKCRDETRPPEPGEEDLPPCAGGAEAGGPWRIRGGQNDFHADTVVCTLAKPFDIPSSVGITMHMSGGARGGTYTVSGVAAGVTWSGNGTYAIEVTQTDSTSMTIEAKGISTIDSPMGRFSDAVEPAFLVSPTRGACKQA